MQMKVGSMLVKAGIISEAQLEEGLRNQVIFGGRIGTNLIELGYLKADQLANFLSKHKGVPPVPIQLLDGIPPEVVALVPADVVKKHQVIPLSLERKRLTVAMANPSDLATIDKLSFMTGMFINPVVIPEILLIVAMERYYMIKRETRYIAISRGGGKEGLDHGAADATGEAIDTSIRESAPESHQQPAKPEVKKPAAPAAKEEEFIEIPDDFAGFHHVEIPEETIEEIEETEAGYNLTEMCSALAGATTRDGIGEALMEYLRRKFFRASLFLPKEPVLTGWLAAAEEGYIGNFSDFKIDMTPPSAFLQVIETKNFYMGQLLNPIDLKVASVISAQDRPAILLPIILMNRVVAILCVVDNLENLTRGLGELQKIAIKAAMSFEILIMRNKIQMV